MHRASLAIRLVLVLTVVLQGSVLAGCSGYERAAMPDDPRWPDPDTPELEVGAEARVHTVDGQLHEGEITRYSRTEVVLGRPSNHGFLETVIDVEEIDRIEVFEGSRFEELAGGTAGLVMMVTAGALVSFALAVWLRGGVFD